MKTLNVKVDCDHMKSDQRHVFIIGVDLSSKSSIPMLVVIADKQTGRVFKFMNGFEAITKKECCDE